MKRVLSLILILVLLLPMLPERIVATTPNTANTQRATAPFPVDYDPNEGVINYGHSGTVGMKKENDTNNNYDEDDRYVHFPDDVAKAKDENGNLIFTGYNSSNAYYDYSDMLNYAISMAKERDNCDIFIEPGVYYFTKSIYLFGDSNINGVAGETVFVIKPNYKDINGNSVDVNGFFTTANLSETYSWYAAKICDISFVVEGTHESFKPTNSATSIIKNLCSDKVKPVDESFSLFYRIRIKFGGIDNIGVSGFGCFQRWSFMDMLTRVTNITVGPTRLVYNGVQTNDAFFYDSYYYGGYYTDENGYSMLPVFQINFSMGTTVFANHYIGNYFFSRSGAGCWCPHTSYSNITFERVYNFVIDTTTESNAVSGCLFKDGAYNDIKKYFESQGLTPFDYKDRYWDAQKKQMIYRSKGYMILDTITGVKHDAANHAHGQYITMIWLHGGGAFTQNKIQCDSLEWTNLVALTNSEWSANYSGVRGNARNTYFSDNAFKINKWDYEKLLVDDWKGGRPFVEGWYDKTIMKWGEKGWNNSDGTPAMGWIGVDGDKDISWVTDDFVYVSSKMTRYIDMSAFRSPNTIKYGYAAQGSFGADEKALLDKGIEYKYYNDMKSGKYKIKYFSKDFGGFSWNNSSNHEKLQVAFDYVATHSDVILYIEAGEYRTDKPIVLRGGANYRVVFENGASIRANKTEAILGKGIFAMSADNNAPISGYMINLKLNMHTTNSSAFYNVNTDGLYIKTGSIERGVGCFTNCKLNNTIIKEGQIQYCDYGFFYKTVTDNTLVKYVYGTASTWTETADGITPGDINYRYFISNSDFAHSTMRGCWLEFGQFSNGKKLTAAGNSIYRGNIIDYTYNYSFGENDMFVGNTLTRASYGSITNHMTGSNFPIDLPDALTNKPMVVFHISDGVKIIGNAVLGTMNKNTLFAMFDSITIPHKNQNGKAVVSISNARVSGNLIYTIATGEWKQQEPVTAFGRAANVDFDAIKNNSFNFQGLYIMDNEENGFKITKDEVLGWCVPGVRTYVNGEYIEVKDTANKTNVTEIETKQPPQTDIIDVPIIENVNDGKQYLIYDFKDRTTQEKDALFNIFKNGIDKTTIAAYIRSSFNNAILPDSNGEKVVFDSAKLKNYTNEQIYQILSQIITYGISKSPSGEDAFYMDGSREGTGDIGDGITNSQNNKNKPTYALVFGDGRIKGQGLKSVSTSVYANLRYSYAWQGKRPSVFIYAEDETKYYGIALGYAGGNSGIFFAPCTIKKKYYEELGKLGEVHYQVGVDFAFNKKTDTSYIDLFSGIKRPYNGEQSKTVFGDYTTIEMFGGDLSKYESLILGIDFTCEYNDTYGTMSAYATIDFGPIGTDKSQTPNLKATTRKVWLGTYDVNNLNKIFGFWAADELWVESVQFEYKPTTTDTCKHTFSDMITREGHCTKDAVIRHKCTKCAYEYEEAKPATGHTFYDRKNSSGKVIRTCRDCGFAFLTDEPLEYECNHKYEKSIIQNVSCDTNGIFNYICKYCGESYTETITATGHKYIVTVVNPTATQKGYTLHTCEKCNDTYTDNETEALGELVNTTENVVKGIAEGDIFKVEEKIAFTPIGANSNIEPIENAQRFIASDWEITPLENWTKGDGNYSFVVYMPGDYKLKVVFKKQEYISGNWKDTTETAQLEIGFKVVEEKIPSDDEIYQPETQNPIEEATEEITNNTGDNIMKNTKSSKKTILLIGIILLITAGTSLGVYFYKKKSKLT